MCGPGKSLCGGALWQTTEGRQIFQPPRPCLTSRMHVMKIFIKKFFISLVNSSLPIYIRYILCIFLEHESDVCLHLAAYRSGLTKMATLVFLLREHARKEKFWLFPACLLLLQPARKENCWLFSNLLAYCTLLKLVRSVLIISKWVKLAYSFASCCSSF